MRSKAWMILFVPVGLGFLGFALNTLVTAVNHGVMPVRVPLECPGKMDWNHVCMTAQTHLNFLGDWITVNAGEMSPGDALMDLAERIGMPSFLVWLVAEAKNLISKLKA